MRTKNTPGVTSIDGTAEQRPWDYQGQTLSDYYQRRVDENPNFQLPAGYHMRDGTVTRGRAADWADWVAGISSAAGLGVMGYGAASMLGPYLASGAAGAGSGGADAAGAMYAAGGPEAAGAASSAVGASVPAVTAAAPATTGASWISKALGTSKDLAPILGNAAKNQADANRFNDTFDLRAAETNAELPDKRLSAALRAALLSKAQPFHINMPMPGAGLRGERATTTGGLDFSNLPPEVKQLMQKVMEDELNQQLAGPIHRSDTSTGDKVLGGAATAASILGALGKYWK